MLFDGNLKLPDNFQVDDYQNNDLKKLFDMKGAFAFSEFLNTREVNVKLNLPNGTYLLVPCNDRWDIDLEFMVRMFSEEKILLK